MKTKGVILLVLLLVAVPVLAAEKVAVLDFKTVGLEADIGMAAAEILRTEMVQTGAFAVVEREQLAALLEEQKLGAIAFYQFGERGPAALLRAPGQLLAV